MLKKKTIEMIRQCSTRNELEQALRTAEKLGEVLEYKRIGSTNQYKIVIKNS